MNLLITGAFDWTQNERNDLKAAGHNVAFMQYEKDSLPCDPNWVEGTVCNGLFLYHPIEAFTSLRYIQLTSAGYDRVNLDYIKQNHIEIHNARGVYSIPMAEFAITCVMCFYKQQRLFWAQQAQHCWAKDRKLRELTGKTVCIIGCGSVGTECAKRFQNFGCCIIGIDIMPYSSPWYSSMLPLENLDEILPDIDVVVLTVPITPLTEHLMSRQRLAALKDGCVLVNIARGGILDQAALIEMLQTRELYAALDVFETEPLPGGSALWEMENVIVTPHNSFVGEENHARMLEVIRNHMTESRNT